MSESLFYKGLSRYFTRAELEKIRAITIGIAGLGGLGSNLAFMLARSGIRKFCLIDCDVVDWSNLNRQHYFPCHVGLKKTEALTLQLKELNSEIQTDCYNIMLNEKNIADYAPKSQIWAEALDNAESKSIFVNGVLPFADFLVSASGLCGIGGTPLIKKEIGKLRVIGDFRSGMEKYHPFAPRVIQASSMMADSIMEFVLKN